MSLPEEQIPVVEPERRPRLPDAPVTWAIIAICAVVWLGELTIPGFVGQVLLAPVLAAREPWRLMTSAFAHSTNVAHIAMNMFALWSVGRPLEYALGRARYAALYLLSALGGSVGFILLAQPPSAGNPAGTDWYTSVVGASGAVFGLFGALLVLSRMLGGSIRSMLGLLLLNAALPVFIPGIAWQAHVGGFLTGLACGAVVAASVRRRRRGQPDRTWPLFAAIAVLLVVLTAVRCLLAAGGR